MSESSHKLFDVADRSDISAARREVGAVVSRIGAPAALSDSAQLVVTELGTNIVRHAGGNGYLLVRQVGYPRPALEILAVDNGPGIVDRPPSEPTFQLGEGLGVGLGTVERLASTFDVFSERGRGTAVLARFDAQPGDRPPAILIGGVSVAVIPSDLNGDGWAAADGDTWTAALVVDGLGHGPAAHEAAQAALSTFPGSVGDGDLIGWLGHAHCAMRMTRGGVVGVVRIDWGSGSVDFAGVGNVAGRVMSYDNGSGDHARHLVPRPGTLGAQHRAPEAGVSSFSWLPKSVILMWSDGLKTPTDLARTTRLFGHDPSLVAAVLHRDFGRRRDDSTVIVMKDAS
jgi:anti-sigma regulatory factor (Ser/Thr protein kinase)